MPAKAVPAKLVKDAAKAFLEGLHPAGPLSGILAEVVKAFLPLLLQWLSGFSVYPKGEAPEGAKPLDAAAAGKLAAKAIGADGDGAAGPLKAVGRAAKKVLVGHFADWVTATYDVVAKA